MWDSFSHDNQCTLDNLNGLIVDYQQHIDYRNFISQKNGELSISFVIEVSRESSAVVRRLFFAGISLIKKFVWEKSRESGGEEEVQKFFPSLTGSNAECGARWWFESHDRNIFEIALCCVIGWPSLRYWLTFCAFCLIFYWLCSTIFNVIYFGNIYWWNTRKVVI